VDPSQKERIILALKKKSHVVGYMGDGINDAPALHAADVVFSLFAISGLYIIVTEIAEHYFYRAKSHQN